MHHTASSGNTSLDLENKVGHKRQGILYQIISRSWKFPFQKDTAILYLIMDLVELAQAFLCSIVWRRKSEIPTQMYYKLIYNCICNLLHVPLK